MSGFRPDLMADRAIDRIRTAPDTDVREAMGNYAATMTKTQLVVVVEVLAARVLEREGAR